MPPVVPVLRRIIIVGVFVVCDGLHLTSRGVEAGALRLSGQLSILFFELEPLVVLVFSMLELIFALEPLVAHHCGMGALLKHIRRMVVEREDV